MTEWRKTRLCIAVRRRPRPRRQGVRSAFVDSTVGASTLSGSARITRTHAPFLTMSRYTRAMTEVPRGDSSKFYSVF